jgi:hypothetical protein
VNIIHLRGVNGYPPRMAYKSIEPRSTGSERLESGRRGPVGPRPSYFSSGRKAWDALVPTPPRPRPTSACRAGRDRRAPSPGRSSRKATARSLRRNG